MSNENSDGWIEHDGGPCPVPGDTLVLVKFRDGTKERDGDEGPASDWGRDGGGVKQDWWKHESRHADNNIVAYRVVKP